MVHVQSVRLKDSHHTSKTMTFLFIIYLSFCIFTCLPNWFVSSCLLVSWVNSFVALMREVWCTQCKITCHNFKDVTAKGKSSTWRRLEAAAGSRTVEPCVCLFHKALILVLFQQHLRLAASRTRGLGPQCSERHTQKHRTLGQTSIYIRVESDHSRHLVFIWFLRLYTIWYSTHEGNTITQFEKAEKNTGQSKARIQAFIAGLHAALRRCWRL